MRPRLLIRLLLACLPLLALLCIAPAVLPVAAQQPTQQPTPAPTAMASPMATATPTSTPTPTVLELVLGRDAANWIGEALRFGVFGLLGLGIAYLVFRLISSYLRGVEGAIEDESKQRAKKAFGLFSRLGERRRVRNYLDWLHNKYGAVKPIGIAGDQVKLEVANVHVPLRVAGQQQIERYNKRMLGLNTADEEQIRFFGDADNDIVVFTLLSEAKCLPKPRPQWQRKLQSIWQRVRHPRQARRVRQRFIPGEEDPPQITPTNRMLLVGKAGSGKTMTLLYGALRLAEAYRRGRPKLLRDEYMRLYLAHAPLPIYVRLTELARSVNVGDTAKPDQEQFFAWLDRHVRDDKVACHDPPMLSTYVKANRAMLLFDGLDEAGDENRRAALADLIGKLAGLYPGNRYLVASRPGGYGGRVRLNDFAETHLSPLNNDECRILLHKLFVAVGWPDPTGEARELMRDIGQSERLSDMATTPLLLTNMAALHLKNTKLPEKRAELYEELVTLLLETWRKQQVGDYAPEERVRAIQLKKERWNIDDLALYMQQQPGQVREVTVEQAQDWLYKRYMTGYKPSTEAAKQHVADLLEALELHSGLMQRRSGTTYAFAHYSFQEYLAACALDGLERRNEDVVAFLIDRAGDSRWSETLLLAAGRWSLDRNKQQNAEQLVRGLVALNSLHTAVLAGDALADIGDDHAFPGADKELAATLLRLDPFTPTQHPDPRTRNRAATLLDRLGADQRAELDWHNPGYWAAQIPAGPFVLGEDEDAFVYTIPQPYALAQFPVTNSQYLAFLETLDGDEAERRRPRYWPGRSFRAGEGNHPVVGVSWYDATAFAAWVDTHLPGDLIRLPTEPEWERAAAYPVHIPHPLAPSPSTGEGELTRIEQASAGRREYPWGDLTETTNSSINAGIPANIAETWIGSTSVVGIFPHGAADCGAQDMSGNVWEWCSTPYLSYEEIQKIGHIEPETLYNMENKTDERRTYVLRGGSWYDTQLPARGAYRHSGNPDYRLDVFGFRLARCSPPA